MKLRNPHVRERIVEMLRCLCDVEFQDRAWIRFEPWQPGDCDTFEDTINNLFRDAEAHEGVPRIGDVLVGEAEEVAVQRVLDAVDAVLLELGPHAAFERWRRSPHWPEVMDAAREARTVMTGG